MAFAGKKGGSGQTNDRPTTHEKGCPMDDIKAKIGFIAPVEVFPGEDEIASLAENGYLILEGKTKIHTYNKDRIIED